LQHESRSKLADRVHCATTKVKTWLTDGRVSYNTTVDHRSLDNQSGQQTSCQTLGIEKKAWLMVISSHTLTIY